MPCRAIFWGFLSFFALLIGMPDAIADRRVALVVGVNEYDHLPRLLKARGDALGMKAALEGLGFEVMIALDPDRRALNVALAELRAKAKDADLVLFHFSGHGVALDGDNYLLARDAPEDGADKGALADEGISQTQLLNRLGVTTTSRRSLIMVLDACRNNPYASRMRSIGGDRGLARVEPPRGAFIFYSAGFGQTALDELGPGDLSLTSVYMRVLLDEMTKSGANLNDIANDTRARVEALVAGNHEQSPAFYDQLDGRRVVLKPGPHPIANDNIAAEGAAWDLVRGTNDASQIEGFIAIFPRSVYLSAAKALLAKLKSAKTATLEPSIPVSPPALAADEIAWSKLNNTRDLRKLKSFISNFPASNFVTEARKQLAALEAEAKPIKLPTALTPRPAPANRAPTKAPSRVIAHFAPKRPIPVTGASQPGQPGWQPPGALHPTQSGWFDFDVLK